MSPTIEYIKTVVNRVAYDHERNCLRMELGTGDRVWMRCNPEDAKKLTVRLLARENGFYDFYIDVKTREVIDRPYTNNDACVIS